MKWFLNVMDSLSRYMDLVAGIALMFIMLLTSFDVVLRYLGRPILGSYDMVLLGGAFAIGFAVPRTSWDKTHVTVDILIDKLPSRKEILNLSTRVISLVFFIILGWNLIKMGVSFFKTGESTLTLALPLYPVALALGLCCIVQCLVLLADMVRIVLAGGNHE
ncbi:MAG TPA: TRAP transporter small permease [Syntrophorhabdaceae bacterium]|nr:TRAP transporter small permease [Syntrophorhabdaceae bacterium]HQM82530.1 TRAP transporter small permease [Syntrophorhabdaceae bacterium]